MAKQDIGKNFEERFKVDWKRCFPNTLIYRLPDQQSGYSGGGSQNPCDFIAFSGDITLLVECKAHAKLSIPFSAIPQYDRLLDYKNLKNVFPGVIIWFYDHDIVLWVDIYEMEKMRLNGEKSIGLRMLKNSEYKIIVIPSEKLRKYMQTDYNFLHNELLKTIK